MVGYSYQIITLVVAGGVPPVFRRKGVIRMTKQIIGLLNIASALGISVNHLHHLITQDYITTKRFGVVHYIEEKDLGFVRKQLDEYRKKKARTR